MATPTGTMEAATSASQTPVRFETSPDRYRHWRLAVEGPVARLAMDVAEEGGLTPGYELKLNSYDLGSTSSSRTPSSA